MTEKITDKLVKKAMRGNPEAYGQLVRYYQEYLYRTAYLYVKNKEDALDMVQECVMKGYEEVRHLRKPECFKSWLTRILINCIYSASRRNLPVIAGGWAEELAPACTEPVEDKWDLYAAIDQLSDRDKTIIILKYFNDMKIKEISIALNMPEGSVKSCLSRARKELKKHLKEGLIYAES